jgi:hypothetical protein
MEYNSLSLFPTINSFEEVHLPSSGKPLIICDIDYTFICPINNTEYFYNKLKLKYPEGPLAHKLASEYSNRSISLGYVRQTDPKGFKKMVGNVELLGGDLIFLTARHKCSHQKTIDDLNRVGINGLKYKIHYTNNQITKGEYIKLFNLTEGYDHVSFIDDYQSYIHSVFDLFPDIKCYLFKYV